MGGLTLVDPVYMNDDPKGQDGEVTTLEDFKTHVVNSEFPLPTLTDEEIEDRSKADGLTKVIAVLQTPWFVLQCVARYHQGLALTELELVTLALASLNFATYAIWWYKPLNVKVPIRIYFTAAPAPAVRVPIARPSNRTDLSGPVPMVPMGLGDARRVCVYTCNS